MKREVASDGSIEHCSRYVRCRLFSLCRFVIVLPEMVPIFNLRMLSTLRHRRHPWSFLQS